ncbi:MAG: S26 family signal peptidase, partial [Chitinophagia bacterium]|nr:S26 family signal peptidase [Chitinophagia bacterium]
MKLFTKPKADGTEKKKKSSAREWLDAALFAIIAATIIRTFVFEAYTIPSGSMEGSMLVNDFLFVSKLAYGPRMPITPIAVPLLHNTIPFIGTPSYSDAVKWKYRRMPGFLKIERNDVVVFNFPNGDTVTADDPAGDYYQLLRERYRGNRAALNADHKILTRPIDKEENYIKRCVAMPGDVLEVRDGMLYINGQPGKQYPHQKLLHTITG